MKQWEKWFLKQSEDDRTIIALNALRKLMDLQLIAFQCDDLTDRFGQTVEEGWFFQEFIYWNDEFKENLRIPV